MAMLFDSGIFSIEGLSGDILPGTTLGWFVSGTSTPLATYSDSSLAPQYANDNPIVVGADGRLPAIWLQNASYKLVITLPNGTVLTRPLIASEAGALATDLASTASGKGAELVAGAQIFARATDFGAVADGATDSTSALVAAIATGRDVLLPEGVTVVGAFTMANNGQRLIGTRASTLKRKAGVTGDLITVTGARCTVSGFNIDGNSANVTYVYGSREIIVKAADCEISDLRITDSSSFPILGALGAVRLKITGNYINGCGDFGIFVNDLSGSGADPSAGICENNTVIEFGINGDGGAIPSGGIGVRSSTGGWRIANNYIQQLTARSNEQLGIECWVDSNNVTVTGNVVDMSVTNSGEFGLSITGKGSVVSGNIVLGTTIYGIELNDRAATCTGNIIRSPIGSGISANLNPAITNSGDIMTITGNVVENMTTVSGTVAGIIVDGSLTLDPIAINITGNTIHGLSTGIQINSTVTGHNISGNTIYNTGSTSASITALGVDGNIANNTIIRVSTAGTGNGGHINLTGSGNFVTGNRISGNARMDYGVLVNSGCANSVIQANFITGATNAVFSNSTSATLFVVGNISDVGNGLNAANYGEGNINTTNKSTTTQGVMVNLGSFVVSSLPTASAHTRSWAFASNGRKNGEGSGSGTGVPVFSDGTAWRACDTGATVAA